MIAYIGQGILGLTAVLAAVGAIFPLSLKGQKRFTVSHFILLLGAFCLLLYAHVTSDFSLATVFRHSHTAKPLLYKISGVWGHHEGSFLLWILMLSGYNMVFCSAGTIDLRLQKSCLTISSAILWVFCVVLMSVCDPFTLLSVTPKEGLDLNPLLQDPALAIHPPLLYLGYVGFCVPFILSLGILVCGNGVDLRYTFSFWYRFTVLPWLFLTVGLGLGSFWAYYELGWGGWWAWDPVENAALMPWLSGLILLHILHVVRGKNTLIKTALFLSLLPFSLALVGTLLVRSGLLTSVHSFAIDPERGLMLSVAIGFLLASAIGVFCLRHRHFSCSHPLSFRDKSGYLGLSLLSVACSLVCVLLGTLYPLGAEFFDQLVCIGGAYYQSTFIPMFLFSLVFIGIAPFYKWGPSTFSAAFSAFIQPHLKAVCLTLVLILGWGVLWPFSCLRQVAAMAVGLWVLSASFILFIHEKGKKIPMFLCHFGMGILILGITISAYHEEEKLTAAAPGDSFSLGPYNLTVEKVYPFTGPNYHAQQVRLNVYKSNRLVSLLEPEKRFYWTQKIIHGETALFHDGLSDLYVSLGEEYADNKWSLHVFYKPGLNLLWGGVFLMSCGLLGSFLGCFRQRRSPLLPLVFWGIICCFSCFLQECQALNAHEQMADLTLEKRARFLYKNLLCPTCGGQNLEGSPSDTAQQMRAQIRQGLKKNLSNDEIVKALQQEYGEQVSLIPCLKKSTIFLWSLPWILFVLLGTVIFLRFKRNSGG